jgi:hypothetical protein
MALHGAERHVVGYKPAHTNRGWGVALFICLLTASLWTMAWLVNKYTFEDPTDPLSPGSEQTAAEHAAPAHGQTPAQGEAAAPAGH